jgi:peptidoglycan hydrolase-like protein with peptidoglycan-binding domain
MCQVQPIVIGGLRNISTSERRCSMNFTKGLVSVAAAAVLAMSPALAQQGGQGGGQVLQQEQAQGSGAQLQLSPSTVRQIQQALNQAGYSVGNVDGSWGPQTAQAMQNFQQAQGLEPTGQPNQQTLSALGVQGGGVAAGGGAGAQGDVGAQGGGAAGAQGGIGAQGGGAGQAGVGAQGGASAQGGGDQTITNEAAD